jgi:hypothetical protein
MQFLAYRTWNKIFILGLTLMTVGASTAASAASSPEPLDQVPDTMGAALHAQMTWTPANIKLQSAIVAFRKRFTKSRIVTRPVKNLEMVRGTGFEPLIQLWNLKHLQARTHKETHKSLATRFWRD